MNHSKVRSHLVHFASPLSLFMIFNVLISTLNSDMASAQPPCYLIDGNGNRINLSGICGKSSQTPVIRQNTTSPSEKTSLSPDANSGNNQPSGNNQATNNRTNSGSTTQVTGDSISVNEKKATEPPLFVPKIQRRRIPLLP